VVLLAACGSPASPTANCSSGECIPAGDLPGWREIFSDDFADPIALGQWSGCSLARLECAGLPASYRSRWWAYEEGWPDTSGNGAYRSSSVVSAADGYLDIFVHTESGVHAVAAVLPLIDGDGSSLGQLYGRYAIRFRGDPVPGYKIAWLLWPDSETWPRDGEIDFPEGNLDGNIGAFMHRRDATAGSDQDAFPSAVLVGGDWHTAVIEWTAESVRFILDGRLLGTSSDRIPNTPMHWVIQTETNLDGYEPADTAAGHIQIDWVAVYSPGPLHSPAVGPVARGRVAEWQTRQP
jgi:hypothetical protein